MVSIPLLPVCHLQHAQALTHTLLNPCFSTSACVHACVRACLLEIEVPSQQVALWESRADQRGRILRPSHIQNNLHLSLCPAARRHLVPMWDVLLFYIVGMWRTKWPPPPRRSSLPYFLISTTNHREPAGLRSSAAASSTDGGGVVETRTCTLGWRPRPLYSSSCLTLVHVFSGFFPAQCDRNTF